MASQEHQVAVPEPGKTDGDVEYFDSELDSDDDVQQTVDDALNPPSNEGPSVRRRIPFEEMLIIWTFKRKNLAAEHHKVMVTGYETTVGDIRVCLASFGEQCEREMNKSAFHYYMKLPDTVTREKVSGDSVYARLLEGKPIFPADLHMKFVNKQFKVNKGVVKGTESDYLKLTKVLMASMFVVGLDTNKTKIPTWMWVLVEDNDACEQFPLGSMSYQFFIGQINAVNKNVPGPYHLKGNTIAFLAWIYEDIPSYGLKIGGWVEQERRPRMLRYSELLGVLDPSERELTTDCWNCSRYMAAFIKEIGDYVGEIAQRARVEVEALLRSHEERIITSVGEYVVKRLLAMERPPVGVSQYTTKESVEQPTTSGAAGMAGQPTIITPTTEKRRWEEMKNLESMHDPYDTNINAIYDDLLSFGEVTPPAQGILPGAVRARGAVELPTIEKATRQEMLVPYDTQINAMYDKFVCLGEVTPPVQEVIMATRQEMLDPSDTQMNTMFDELVCLGELTTPAQGILPGAGGATGGLEQPMVENVIAIDLECLNGVHSNIALVSSYFMETVEEVFDVMHRGMREEFQRYDHKLFDPTVEEVIPVEEMDRLCLFAEAVQPNWGENMKQ
ncbi:hypothetical protein OROGR_022301 [Orobanche gracilis]